MDQISRITITIAFIGLAGLIVGFTTRDRPYGTYLMWAGVMCMIGVVVYHIVKTVQS
ncbi:MAG TPA: hypothetical protein PKL49_09315 [Steroidobacteraceae bacterium]|nr:hypothetical protein [Steroidobacteraceae bacterium]HNS26538.1 hypothetical protein [Steroidobacteraceae bacterium]